jgi:hypothetical protein
MKGYKKMLVEIWNFIQKQNKNWMVFNKIVLKK